MSDLETKAQNLVESFLSLDVVKKYLKVSEEMKTNKRVNNLKKEIVDSKKNLKNIPFEKRGEEVRRIKILEDKYDQDSLVCSYNQLKKEVQDLAEPIRNLFIF